MMPSGPAACTAASFGYNLLTQLRKFKAQTRADLDGNMTSVAQPLSDRDIEILADYLAGLSPQ
jgi:cytochrome c553